MKKWNLLRRTAPAVLSIAVLAAGTPATAFAADEFTSGIDEVYQEADSFVQEDVFISSDEVSEDAVFTAEDDDLFFAEETESEDLLSASGTTKVEYVLMNIPYADFYKAEVNNSVEVDGFTSATKAKTRTGSLAGGSYHVSDSGEDITGVIYPVKVNGVDLSAYKQITDKDKVEITTTNRGQTNTATYTGKEALFENPSYSYYVLNETPSYYKELTVTNGVLSFGKAVGNVTEITGADARLITETSYGDYQLNLDGVDAIENATVNAVVISTKEGNSYGLRHVENIWLKTQLAWSTGFTTEVHNCPTSSAHYVSMMGQTINKVTYYTSDGIFEIPLSEIKVPVKFAGTVQVNDAKVSAGKTKVSVSALPSGFKAQYSVSGLSGAKVSNGVLTYATTAEPGSYTLKVEDTSGKYVGLSTTFVLSASSVPAVYYNNAKALKAASGVSAEKFASYISKITSVSVDGTEYAASGRGATVIINEDGSIKKDAEPIAASGTYNLVVKADGYPDLAFTYTDKVTITLNQKSAVLYAGGNPAKVTLSAVVDGSEETVTYKSSDTSVASVSAKGVVTAKAKGTAVITASVGSVSATCKITVKTPSVKLNKTKATLYTAGTTKLTLTTTKTGLAGTVKYTSSAPKVASVSSKGVVTAKKTGTAVITATCGNFKATCKITVKTPSVKLNKTKATLYTKGSTKLTLTATKTGLTGTVKYTSSAPKIASVSSKGVVTAKKTGTAVITATCGSYKATCKITVKAPSLTLSKTSGTVKVGKTVTIKASATPSGTITYVSSNKKVATVSSKGVVKGVKKGTATIKVTCNGVTKTYKITVK